MNLDKWVSGCKVNIFPWIDHKHIYVNVQYFKPGQSLSRPPVWENTVFIVDDDAGRFLAYTNTETLVNAIRMGQIPNYSEIKVN